MNIYNQNLKNLTLVSKNPVAPIGEHESEKEDHEKLAAMMPFKSTSAIEGVPIPNDDYENGIPLPNGDDEDYDDDYDVELVEKDTTLNKSTIQGKIRAEPS